MSTAGDSGKASPVNIKGRRSLFIVGQNHHRPLLIQHRCTWQIAERQSHDLDFPKSFPRIDQRRLGELRRPISLRQSSFRFAQPPPESSGSQHNGNTRGRPLIRADPHSGVARIRRSDLLQIGRRRTCSCSFGATTVLFCSLSCPVHLTHPPTIVHSFVRSDIRNTAQPSSSIATSTG